MGKKSIKKMYRRRAKLMMDKVRSKKKLYENESQSILDLETSERSMENIINETHSILDLDNNERSMENIINETHSILDLDNNERSMENIINETHSILDLDNNERSMENIINETHSILDLDNNERSMENIINETHSILDLDNNERSMENIINETHSILDLDNNERHANSNEIVDSRLDNIIEPNLNSFEWFPPERNSSPRVYEKHGNNTTKINNKTQINTDPNNNYDASERLIIDKNYFFEKLKIISNHAPQFGCTLINLDIIGETKIGLNSKLKLSCNMCKATFIINTSDPQPTQNLDINTAAVTGITSTGIGLEQFRGLCAAMNLPILTPQLYFKKHAEVCDQWEKTAHEVMAAAAEREKQAAIEEGRVKDGVAVIDVIADGCWSKRSYKSNYSALSGAAAIVGRKYKEVLFMGVKNKYCCICARASGKNVLPGEHECFKNYSGSSSSMEAEIITEGFKKSLEMYNIIYGRLIADGDSSTYSKILEARPYKGITVEKIECRNHVLRNMCNKLVTVSKDTKYALSMRKMLTTQRILAIRKVICLAIKFHKNDAAEIGIRINNLYNDISNSYNHAFGCHTNCLDQYCTSERKNEDLVPKIKNTAFWAKIQHIVGTVASHARSLIHDCDSNTVEQFNSIVAKFVGGKRTNLVQRRTYQSRAAAAVVAFNTNKPLYHLQKALLGKSPKSKIIAFEEKRVQKNKLKRNTKARRILYQPKRIPNAAVNKDYGTDSCQKPDMDKDTYDMAKQIFLKNLQKNDIERSQIERATILQRDCSEWLELRRNLLTASNFGKIIKRRPTTSASIVKTLLYKSDISNVVSIKHGVNNEAIALNQLAVQEGVQINTCGLFIDSEISFLAATPDGLIGNDTIVEIKCPLSAYKLPILEAVKQKKVNFWNIKNNSMVINKNHPWYYQIQGQLHISKRNLCLFGVWSGENHVVTTERIHRDDDFWKNNMVGKLTEFYMEHILPELVDARKTRNMPLRVPPIPIKRQNKDLLDAGPSKLPRKECCTINSNFDHPNIVDFDFAVDSPAAQDVQKVLAITEY